MDTQDSGYGDSNGFSLDTTDTGTGGDTGHGDSNRFTLDTTDPVVQKPLVNTSNTMLEEDGSIQLSGDVYLDGGGNSRRLRLCIVLHNFPGQVEIESHLGKSSWKTRRIHT